ncbi:MAG: sodium-dependent transporter [Candidatus Riflebacteria bacterium HGW-Riflebacteria-1]|jgi:NSS family neurotransmitter:Na+ symporter|nr:MAG: sodium-dependent transporter [Candidatus Riflebacteria bacterium HGW-Riflebacteria-1]
MDIGSPQERGQWGSKLGFIMAAAGSAVGLGNLWKFPFLAGQNGGGAFVLVYFLILFVVGFTLMMAEITVGRYTQLNAIGAYRKIKASWAWVGSLGVIAGFLILSFYSVIGGWIIAYIVKAASGAFNTADTKMLGDMFTTFIQSAGAPLFYHGIFMLLTLGIVIGGIQNGIEKYSKILMPALLIMIVLVMIRSITLDGAMEGVKFFLNPDFSKITGGVILSALGQVFFSLSLGMGCMITYGSYLSKDTNIPECAFYIPLIDTGVALLAGLAILPAVFAFNFPPDAGPGLLFITLPAVFSKMPMGSLMGVLFFTLALFAAITSSISLLEVCVSYVVDEWNWTRKKATLIIAGLIFAAGVPCSLSQGPWSHIKLIKGKGILDSVDFVASNILLPLGGILLCVFIGWVWGLRRIQRISKTDEGKTIITWELEYTDALKEVTNDGKINFALAPIWVFLIKWLAPVAIGIVFIQGIF